MKIKNHKWNHHFFKTCIIFILCSCLQSNNVFGQALSEAKADSLIALAEETESVIQKAQFYLQAADIYHRFDPQKGLAYSYMSLDLALDLDDYDLLGSIYQTLGSNYIRLSDYENSLMYYQKSVDNYRKADNQLQVGAVLGNMGFIMIMLGDNAGGLELQFEVLKIFEDLGHKTNQANTLLAISTVYQYEEQFELAIQYGEQSLELYKETDDVEGMAFILGNLGNLHKSMGNVEISRDYSYEALSLFRELGQFENIARTLTNLHSMLKNDFRFTEAYEYLIEALEIFEAIPNPTGIGFAKINIGTLYLDSHLNRNMAENTEFLIPGTSAFLLQNAVKYLSEALSIFEELGELKQVSSTNEYLFMTYEELGNYELALNHHKQFTATKDSLNSIERAERIEQLTTQREIELREKQIELDRLAVLKKRNERVYFIIGMFLLGFGLMFVYRNYSNQRKANVVLDGLNKEIADKNENLTLTLKELRETQEQLIETERQKQRSMVRERISQDIHDDISSGLTKISWLAELMKTRAAKNPEVDLTMVEKINGFARDSVTKLGEIIWSTNPERDNLASLLAYMRDYITKYMEDAPIKCKVDFPAAFPEDTINPELRRNVYLVMKEALHNAMKYSGAKKIEVSFLLDDDNFEMIIADNGKGMEPGVIEGGGNGMANMRKRMEKIGGTFDVISASGEGTKVVCKGKVF